MNDEADGSVILPPSAELAADFRRRLESGLDLLAAELPELAGEVRAIIRDFIIVAGDPTGEVQLDGGSHYQLWGALFLNGAFHQDDVSVVEVVAHESAHSLLFGFCTHEPLVLNEDEERYASPLRQDKRPMDGIYHATFVSARMHLAMSTLALSPRLSAAERERALAAARLDLANFDAGYAVVEAAGRLTPLGRQLMDNARRYVETVR
jgi:HEXXH motif-containing protein